MSDQFLGEIRAMSFNYPPKGWAFCNGQILPINQNQALFALLGTTYGGNGTTNFQLPNLQGRLAIGSGQGPGLTNRTLGETGGEASHVLTVAEIPAHRHSINAYTAPGAPTNTPDSSVILASASTNQSGNPGVPVYGSGAPTIPTVSLGQGGGSQPHENQMPYLVMNYCIAMVGIFPSRN
jgi:microcystin-dependent protein